ncbi:MAG: DNA alkylation repair protein [Actinomycetia bacterium]|nr:DNA alkylation repair protein [Actinomycetes bacterium]
MTAASGTGPPPRQDVIDALDAALRPHADPERAVGQQRYMKSALPYLGLTSPVLRRALRPVLGDPACRIADRGEWEATVRAVWGQATHREHWYAALALLGHRAYRPWQDPQLLPLIEDLVRNGAWWDVVDDLATHFVRDILLAYPGEVAVTMRDWSLDEDLWIRRTAMLCQIGAKAATDTDLLTDVIEPNIEHPDFFSRKAIGWALREYAKTDPDWVRAFVEHHPNLSGLSRREALKHL